MAEESTDKAEDAATEAKGLAEQFLQTLGLVDLIIGALLLYLLRLWAGTMPHVFESTGYPWVDVALLACAAAFVGKIVSFSADLFAGLRDFLRSEESYTRLNNAIANFRTVSDDHSSIDGADPIDLASRYVANANPRLEAELEALYNATTIAYSVSFLAILYGIYFGSKKAELADLGPPVLLVIIPIALAVGFVIYGLFKQRDYIDAVTDHLNYVTLKLTNEKQHQAEGGNNRQITVVPSRPISIDLSGQNIFVEVTRVKRRE